MELSKMKILLLFLGISIIPDDAEGATRYDATSRVKLVRSRMTTETNTSNSKPTKRYSIGVILQMSQLENLVSVDMVKTAQGRFKRRLKETYAGYDVIGFGVEADYDPRIGYTGTVSGEVLIGIQQDIQYPSSCTQTKKTLIEIAMMNSSLSDGDPHVSETHTKKKVFLKDNGNATWVYEVDFLYISEEKVTRPFYIIDACDLTILVTFDRVNNVTSNLRKFLAGLHEKADCDDPTTTTTPVPTSVTSPVTVDDCDKDKTSPSPTDCSSPAKGVGGNLKTGKYEYGVSPRCINPEVEGQICILETEHVKVIDLKQSRNRNNKAAANFTCSKGYDDAVNDAFSPVMDAFFFGYTTVQAIRKWYNIDPLGFKPVMYVHYGVGYENAFWDGKSLTFGDGKNFFYPLVSLDVVAHELGHGITTRFSNLYYSKQSGGINEAFSDITGELVEAFAISNDWKVGFELRKHPTKALRYFKDPTLDGRSIKHFSQYKNGLDVHFSSGLFNHAFYQLVEVQKMPIKDAYHCFIQANRIYWKQQTNFEEGACGVVRSAHDLGFNTYIGKIKSSFAVVGINMTNCKESSYMEMLTNGDKVYYLTVSHDKNPMFLLDHPLFASSVTITATTYRRYLIGIELTTSVDGSVVAYNGTSLTYTLEDSSPLYVSLSSDTFSNRVMLTVTYSLISNVNPLLPFLDI